MKKGLLKSRTVNVNKCRNLKGNKSCSVSCEGANEVILIPLETLNQMLKDKKIDALVVSNFVSEHITEIKDARQIKALFGEFGLTGKAYEKTIRGTKYIIFKGKPGLRKLFTGTKYGVGNSKVLSYGVGKAGFSRSIKVGTVYSLVFVNAWNIAEYFIKNDKSLTDLGVTMASDSVKVILASAAGGIAGGIAVTLGAPILVPLAAGLAVAILVGMLLDKIDEEWHITESFRAWAHDVVDETIREKDNLFYNISKELNDWENWLKNFRYGF